MTHGFTTALAVAVAGAAGTLGRYGATLLGLRWFGPRFPWATLAINVVGAFAVGLVMASFAARDLLDSRLRIALSAGFLGGFTTYSSFAFETVDLVERRGGALAVAYVAATLVLGIAGCGAGIWLGRR